MDIMKGSLDGIARPAVVSRSRPGSRISSAHSVEKLKLNSTLGSFEVLTPDVGVAELLPDQRWLQKSPGELSNPEEHEPEDTEILISSGKSSKEDNLELYPERNNVKENSQTPCLSGEETDFGGLQDPTENITDHKLEKAIRKMQALDEILLKKLAKEMAVKARGIQMRKQLWEELQLVTMQTSGRSHEESVNTNRFLALTPQLDEAEDAATYEIEKLCSPVFATQLPAEENECDVKESRQGNLADSVLLNNGEQSSQTAKNVKSKTQAKGVDFIQRNIMLAKDAGSIVLLLDDEKLRLEQLLEDIQDDTSDEELLEDVSCCIVPGEGYTPEPVEYDRLAKIEAELQVVLSSKDLLETSYPGASSPKRAFQEASTNKTGNLETAPGEKVLRHTKEIRKEKLRMREIEMQLEEIQQSLSSASLTSEHCGSLSPESSICFENY